MQQAELLFRVAEAEEDGLVFRPADFSRKPLKPRPSKEDHLADAEQYIEQLELSLGPSDPEGDAELRRLGLPYHKWDDALIAEYAKDANVIREKDV